MSIPNQTKLFEEFRKCGYAIAGDLERTLTLEKLPLDTRLRSILIIKNLKNGQYSVSGGLYADGLEIEVVGVDETKDGVISLYKSDERKILRVDKNVQENQILQELGLIVLTTFESYFGESNREVPKKVNAAYKIQPTL